MAEFLRTLTIALVASMVVQGQPVHRWHSTSSGTLITAGLVIDSSQLADAQEKVTIIIACNVATASPVFQGGIYTQNVGVDAAKGVRFAAGAKGAEPLWMPLPVIREGYTPQNVQIGPGFLPTLAKQLSQAARLQLSFTDAFGKPRAFDLTIENGADLLKLVSPCTP
jgi:hypothetical protein